jgi:glutamate-1-semialdehyde 2,1-aminomutase
MPASNTELFARAKSLLPGGVNSPVRAFKSGRRRALLRARASGPYLWDVEGKRYIDYVGSWGPMIAGHAHPRVIEAVQRTANAQRLELRRAECAGSDDGGTITRLVPERARWCAW